jgi:peptide/nickel transport system ATP-binding protein
MSRPVLVVEGLRIEVAGQGIDIVDEVSFEIASGEILGLVGESGSGKTTVGLALLGHSRRGAKITSGRVAIDGRNLLELSPAELRTLRGSVVSYVPQDPGAALNPSLRIGKQLDEVLVAHDFGASAAERRARLAEMLDEVLLPGDAAFLERYPHQLSGGQQQRVGLAMAFACRPRVIVLDEPTTGLDVTTQAHVLETVRSLCDAHGVAALYVSHDLAVVATLADRVAVMYAGRVVETGSERVLFQSSAHPYTRRLVEAIPELSGRHTLEGIPGTAPRPGRRPAGCFFAPRCTLAVGQCHVAFPPLMDAGPAHQVRCHRHFEVTAGVQRTPAVVRPSTPAGQPGQLLALQNIGAAYGDRQVVFDISLGIELGQCFALVGESGSGKTTLARCVAGLHRSFTGEILFSGRAIPHHARQRDQETLRRIQYVFQSPYSSLNPRKTVGQIIAQPLQLFFEQTRAERHAATMQALDRVSLNASVIDRYPHELSGGERQRVAIARALVAGPRLLVCDEITSALDVSVQAAIVELLSELRRETGIALLFVTHNLALIRTIADEVAVMSRGRIVEQGAVDDILDAPSADYTKTLLASTPSREGARVEASA